MRSTHPSTYLLRALICDNLGEDHVRDGLSKRGLAPYTQDTYSQQLRILEGYQDIEVMDPTNSEWLRGRGIYTYFREKDVFAKADRLFTHGQVCSDVERMMLGGLGDSVIADHISKFREFYSYTSSDVRVFRHYFWNTSLLSKEQLISFLHDSKASDYHVEALVYGKRRVMQRMGEDLNESPNDLHTRIMMSLGVRCVALDNLPYTKDTHDLAARMGKAFSGMWKDSKTVGEGGMLEAIAKLKTFSENRNTPSIPVTGTEGTGLPPLSPRFAGDSSEEEEKED